jgi:ribosomal-protein-alanine N-acetyltransferase
MHNFLITSKRCILRSLMETDAPAIFEYAKSSNVTQWTSWDTHKSIEDSLLFIRHIMKESQTTICQPLGIVLKQKPNEVIGTIGFSKISNELDSEALELAYALAEPYWNQGIITEVSFAVLDWLLQTTPDIKYVYARCSVENIASQHVLKKLGMHLEHTINMETCGNKKLDIQHYVLSCSKKPKRANL